MIKKLLLSLLAGFMVIGTLSIFISTPTYADAASFCSSEYSPTNSPEQAACLTGYEFGDSANPICSAQFSRTVEFPVGSGTYVPAEDIQAACVAGFQQWEEDDAACNGNSQCESELRSNSEPLTGAGGNAEDQTEPGPIPGSADVGTLEGDERIESTECGIESFFGDLICGFSKTFANIADSAFWLLTLFLKTPPIVSGSDGPSEGIYNAWVNMRNIANVAFVAAFIVVIYSQLTGIGISNYHIKKMIPRLIVAAIMINVSYYLAALMVDLSNVLGATITSFMTEVIPPVQVDGGGMDTWKQIVGVGILLTAPVIAAGAAYLYLSLAVIIPVLASVVIVLAVTLLMLILRQALIIVFIIISPLAMAALILPGTRQYFDKWRKIFIPLIMLYPAIAVVYGGAHIAGQIISQVGYASDSMILAVAALGIQVIPLMLTPALMKLGGGLMNRYAGIAQSSTPVGKFKQKADEYAKYRGNVRINQALNRQPGGKIRTAKNALTSQRDKALGRKITKEAARKDVDLIHDSAMEDYAIDQINNEDKSTTQKAMEKASFGLYEGKTKGEQYREQVAGTNDSKSLSSAKARTLNKKVSMRASKVKAQALKLSRGGVSGKALTNMAVMGVDQNGNQVSEIQREAAILRIAQMGDAAGVVQLMKVSGEGGAATDDQGQAPPLTVEQRQQLVSAAQASGGVVKKAPFIMNEAAADNIRQGFVTEDNFSQTVVGNSIASDDYSPETLTTLDPNGGNELVDAANIVTDQSQVNDPSIAGYDSSKAIIKQQTEENNSDLKEAAQAALATTRTNSAISGGRDSVEKLAGQTNSGSGS